MDLRPSQSPESRPNGFSLIELLVVIAVIALVSALAVAGMGALAANRIATTALDLRAAAEQARQRAMTTGSPVELRIYKSTTSPHGYSAFRVFGFTKLNRMPDGIQIISSQIASTILDAAPTTNEAPPGFSDSDTLVIRFLPDGSIQGLPTTGPQTLSIAKTAEPALTNDLPANFATISFDAVLGSTAIYRP